MKWKKSGTEATMARWGLIFASPWVIGLCVFYLYPVMSSLVYSFFDYNGIKIGKFVGFGNFKEIFLDELFKISVINTLYYTIIAVPTSIVIGVFLALLLNANIRGRGIFRTIFFIPTLVPGVAVAIIWQWLLNSQFGYFNYLLSLIGIKGPGWFESETWSKPALAIVAQWTIGGAVVTYLAGLQDIPRDYYEAAEIDGANAWQKIWHITLPLLSPVIFYNLIMSIIGAFQQFTLPFVITGGTGNPANSMLFYGLLIYRDAFSYFKMGRACAESWLMFVVVMAITLVLYKSSNRWVHYMGEE